MNNSLEKVDMRAKFIVLDDLFVNEVDMYKDTDTICDFKCLTCNDVYKSSINKIVYFYEHKGKPYTEVCACGKSNSNNEIKYEDVIQGYEDLFKEFKLSGKKTTMYASTCINCGSKFMASSNTIRRRGKLLCYECSKKGNFDAKSSNNYKSLSELVKGIEDYWSDENILKPNEIKIRYSSREKFKTICPYCNKIIEKRYDAILRSGPYCGPCAKRVNVDIDDSLEYMYPFTAKKYDESEKNKLPSNSIHSNSHEKYWFHCDICNQDFEKSLSVMVRAEKEGVSGCPICRGFKVVEGVNDLLSKNVYGSMYWDYDKNTISPKMVRYSSDNKYWFKCLQGHSFKMSPRKLLRAYNENSDGCPVCSGRRLVKGVNDVATVYKGDLSRWSKNSLIQPDEVTMGSNKIITVLCANCGKEFNTSVYNYTHDSVCFCDNCRNHNYSKAEKDIVKYIRSLGFNVEENVDIGGHKSVDILIREKGIAFDYNGLYRHSTEVRPNKNYHLNRIGYVKDVLNARLYYIWEDDYKLKPYN